MVREEDKQLRLKQQRSKEAIDLAMQARWQEAVEVNKEAWERRRVRVRAWLRTHLANLPSRRSV